MTQSDNIKEFLKYASPRLDYIEHCMEKQALSPARALQAVKAFRARTSKGLINPAKYKRLGALSESVGKLRGKEKNQLKNVAGKLHKKYYDGNYVKGDYSRVQQRAAAPSFEEAYFNQYGRMPDADMVRQSTIPAPKAPTWQDEFYVRNGYAPDQHANALSNVNPTMLGNPGPSKGTGEMLMRNSDAPADLTARRAAAENAMQNLIPDNTINNTLGKMGFPRQGTGEMLMSDAGTNAAKARDAFIKAPEVQAPGKMQAIKSWMSAHPYLTAGGGLGVGLAGGAGLGYGLGHGAGQQDGAQTAQRYYELRAALDSQRLRQTNDSFLSRLANLFGTGELSNMIG